ncbi:MAG TPA: DUF3618 domain-containing protein [Candidatus Cybelea sp.]|nr:DUF3618 domain-containing protein [Candidatus Cybelea sp.]
MSQDPEAIRRDIEDTQTRMGETVEALAYKTDVPARTRDAVNDRIDTIKGAVTGVAANVRASAANAASSAANAIPSREDAAESLRAMNSLASRNPLGIAIGSVAVGFLVGLCLPVSDIERDRVGQLGEQMTDQAKAAASNAIEQGKAAVTQAIGDALTTSPQSQTYPERYS